MDNNKVIDLTQAIKKRDQEKTAELLTDLILQGSIEFAMQQNKLNKEKQIKEREERNKRTKARYRLERKDK